MVSYDLIGLLEQIQKSASNQRPNRRRNHDTEQAREHHLRRDRANHLARRRIRAAQEPNFGRSLAGSDECVVTTDAATIDPPRMQTTEAMPEFKRLSGVSDFETFDLRERRL